MEQRFCGNITQKRVIRDIPLVFVALLVIMLQSCEYEPYSPIGPICIERTRSSNESKNIGAYMAQYRPVDTLVEYHDSLIDIKFKIIEAYLECDFRKVYRFPPYKTEHYRYSKFYHLVIVADVDSCCTINSSHDKYKSWWDLGDKVGFQGYGYRTKMFIISELGSLYHDPKLDTLSIPIHLGYTYENLIWKDWQESARYTPIPVQRVIFILEDTLFQGNTITYASAQKALTEANETVLKYGPLTVDCQKNVSEMDSLYPRFPKEELMKKLLWMYKDYNPPPPHL